jgi:methylisocitrate lyase
LKAGADAIFPEALQTPEEFREFAKAVDAPLLANMTEFGRSPLLSVQELSELGYRMVIFPQTIFRATMRTAEELLRDLKASGTQQSWLDRMQTRKELYELLGYRPNKENVERRTPNAERPT